MASPKKSKGRQKALVIKRDPIGQAAPGDEFMNAEPNSPLEEVTLAAITRSSSPALGSDSAPQHG